MYTQKQLEKFKMNSCPFFKDCISHHGYCREVKENICEPPPNDELDDDIENIEISHTERLRDLNSYEF